ncbi:uncharacterized protein LOC106639770 [Copidosoma floridanum]|uniref:uncharacterized protein LOC106639770 n=1 Tax=Copidosoma floridanum TaxID=29053 RepID=UPI0006C96EE3|nr:uncharacterized protein LOC106639770 [Copidosoma floridanum]
MAAPTTPPTTVGEQTVQSVCCCRAFKFQVEMDACTNVVVGNEVELTGDDFEDVVAHPDLMKDNLRKLKEACNNYKNRVIRLVQESKLRFSERAKQLEKSYETMAQLSGERLELKESLETIRLEQKVVEKKTMNSIREIDRIRTEMELIKEKKETLSLEIVDLQQEIDNSRDHLKKQWEAIKKACSKYKNVLDIHIDTEMVDHIEHVTVTYFWSENPTDHKFFVILQYENDCWKVKKIEPELSAEQKYQLNHVVHFSKQSEVQNVTALLSELRILFLKNYF